MEAEFVVMNAETSQLSDTYRSLVSALTVATMFTAAPIYMFKSNRTAIHPFEWALLLAALSTPFWLTTRTWRVVTASPVLAWGAAYILVTTTSFVWSTQSSIVVDELRNRILGVLIIPMFLGIFSSPKAIMAARKTMIACVLVAVGTNCIDTLNPLTFSTVFGRAAGFYQNPNSSAVSLLLGLVFTIHVVSPRFRSLYVVVVAAGVAMTLSRAGVLCGLLLVVYLMRISVIRARQLVTSALLTALAVTGIIIILGEARHLAELLAAATRSGALGRLLNPDTAIQGGDESTNARAAVARLAWQLFKEHPIIGAGVGATVDWSFDLSTHNIYLRFLAEFGVMGLVIYPLSLYSTTAGARGEARQVASGFLLLMLPFGLFSHNVVDQFHHVLTMSLMAAMTVFSRTEHHGAATVLPSA